MSHPVTYRDTYTHAPAASDEGFWSIILCWDHAGTKTRCILAGESKCVIASVCCDLWDMTHSYVRHEAVVCEIWLRGATGGTPSLWEGRLLCENDEKIRIKKQKCISFFAVIVILKKSCIHILKGDMAHESKGLDSLSVLVGEEQVPHLLWELIKKKGKKDIPLWDMTHGSKRLDSLCVLVRDGEVPHSWWELTHWEKVNPQKKASKKERYASSVCENPCMYRNLTDSYRKTWLMSMNNMTDESEEHWYTVQ